MTTSDLCWRVSVATLDRVVFLHPEDGTQMLALERKASVMKDAGDKVRVRAQPFGGGVRILNSAALQQIIGEFKYDSERSRVEQDFRILISPAHWEPLKQFCLQHLSNQEDTTLESGPQRELLEEFEDILDIRIKPEQYTFQPVGFVIEDNPVPTENVNARGLATVRLYQIFEVRVVDHELCAAIQAASQRYTDQDLAMLAIENAKSGGLGRANSVLALPLKLVSDTYLAMPPETRYQAVKVDNHYLDESVLAVLEGVEVAQYQRL